MAFLLKRHYSIEEIPAEAWQEIEAPHFPFTAHAFFLSLERGQCLDKRRGWRPMYITTWHQQQLVGALYLFERDNSYGEYIFDTSWADAYHRHHLPYYPKGTAAVPFTPANGPKFLSVESGPQADAIRQALLNEAEAWAKTQNLSSLHFLFTTADEAAFLATQGYITRETFQFQWQNHAYPNFDAFLQALKPKRRKEIIRERATVDKMALRLHRLAASELTPTQADAMYALYIATISRKGGLPYLTRAFFREIFARMPEAILMETAHHNGHLVAATFNMHKGQALYGRYWGAADEIKNLHFEMCYYRLIETAIQHTWQKVEAGAQGVHKLARGFVPTVTHSAHKLFHPVFHHAISQAVAHENAELKDGLADPTISPFKRVEVAHASR